MSLEDKERLEKEANQKVREEMSDLSAIEEFFHFTLKNFAYRYIESESTGPLNPQSLQEGGKETILIQAKEDQLSHALKTQNKETRQGLIHLAKSFSKKDKPQALYQIGVTLKDLNSQGGGEFLIFAEVSWDFPDFESSELRNRSELKLQYEDALDLRNNFARHLEEVCEVL